MATYKGNPIIQLGVFNKKPWAALPETSRHYHEGHPLKWLENALEDESGMTMRDHFDTASKTFALLGFESTHCGFAVCVEMAPNAHEWVTVDDYNDIMD